MTTLVTGSTGPVGAPLVRLLAEQGARPRVLLPPGPPGAAARRLLAGVPCEQVEGAVTDLRSLRPALRGVTHVVHAEELLRLSPAARPALQRVNVEGTRNVVRAALEAGVRRLVHVSSAATVGPGTRAAPATEDSPYELPGDNPYAQSKRQAEQVALAAGAEGLEVVVANPGLVVGGADAGHASSVLLLAVARGWLPFSPPGSLNAVAARDVAQGLLLLRDRGVPGRRYLLGGENLSWRALLTLCAEEAGVPPPRLPLPEALLRAVGQAGDLGARLAPAALGRVSSAALRVLWLRPVLSSARAQAELGYTPGPLRHGVREAYRWLQQEGDLPRTRALTPRGALGAH